MTREEGLPHRDDHSHNHFDRHPLLTGITIAVVLVLVLDLIIGTFAYRRSRVLLRTGLGIERSYRRRDSVYHHGLKPMMQVDSALWGSEFYRVRTNWLGVKDATARTVDCRPTHRAWSSSATRSRRAWASNSIRLSPDGWRRVRDRPPSTS